MVRLSGAGGQCRLCLGEFFHPAVGLCAGVQLRGAGAGGELDTRRFWKARFTRLYPIYLLSLILSLAHHSAGIRAHTHAMFWTGMVLTPLLLQGWIPEIATFLNTPAWTMSAESFYYCFFPGWRAGSGRR